MRTVPSGLLSSPTRCLAVLVIRADGVKWGLSDANVPFVYSGVTFEPYNGFDASTVMQGETTDAGDFTVTTIESAIAAQITPLDILAKRYENARVWVAEIDYLNASNGWMVISQYFVTKAVVHDSNVEVSLAEITYRLKGVTGRTLKPVCCVTQYGNLVCDPQQTIRTRDSFSRTVSNVVDLFTIQFSGDAHAAGYFSSGELIWTSGQNLGCPAGDIKIHTVPSSGVCQTVLEIPFIYPVSVGEVATLVFGCDRLKATCQSVVNTNNPTGTNVENFQGFDLPIPDMIHVIGRAGSATG